MSSLDVMDILSIYRRIIYPHKHIHIDIQSQVVRHHLASGGAEGLPVIHDFVVRHGRTQGPNQSKSEKRFVNQLLVLPGAVEQLVLYDCILWLWWDMGLDGTKYVVEVVNQLWVLPFGNIWITFGKLTKASNTKVSKFQIMFPLDQPLVLPLVGSMGW